MGAERDLAPGEWSVLALLANAPNYGWALAREMSPSGEIGSVWSIGRPIVYRALELLETRGLVERVGNESGARGPNRELFAPTQAGYAALARWLVEPVEHVREIRSVFLLKLVLIARAGADARPLLEAQRAVVAPALEALAGRLASSVGSERIFVRFRLESTRGVLDFIDALLAEDGEGRGAPPPEPRSAGR